MIKTSPGSPVGPTDRLHADSPGRAGADGFVGTLEDSFGCARPPHFAAPDH
ncbi:hypothetical protein ABZ890_25050 [Streptomyces sp. NPDC046984]|uniref:hypothetical protein n=1 Tax=Streptomyces sp. NPDC046984 TaxID=3155138 RepID=UPI0033F16AC2